MSTATENFVSQTSSGSSAPADIDNTPTMTRASFVDNNYTQRKSASRPSNFTGYDMSKRRSSLNIGLSPLRKKAQQMVNQSKKLQEVYERLYHESKYDT